MLASPAGDSRSTPGSSGTDERAVVHSAARAFAPRLAALVGLATILLLSSPVAIAMKPTVYADVTAFGARGDGMSDDTAAFRAAAATGKPIWIPRPPAHYRLSGTVNLVNGIHGDGSMPRIRMYGSTGDYAHTMFVFNQAIGTAAAPIEMNGLWLDGQWDGTTKPAGEWTFLVQVARSSYVEIHGNVIANPKGDCIYVGSETLRPTGTSDHVDIHDNKLWKPYRCAIAIISATNGTIVNNQITKTNSYVNAVDFEPNNNTVEYVRDWTVSGNWFNSTLRGAVSARRTNASAPWSGNLSLTSDHGTWPSDTGSLSFFHFVSDSLSWTNVTTSNNVRDGTAPPAP